MAYRVKREHLKKWDLQQMNDDLQIHLADDEEDIYISERSSITSSNDTGQLLSPANKRLPTPTVSSRKTPHSLRYNYNDLPPNGIPAAVQFQQKRKEDKKKIIRKAPPGQGNLVPLPQVRPPDTTDNYYPYWYYYKLKNPDWIMQHRQPIPGRKIPYDSYDPSKYLPQPALTTSPFKPRKRASKPRPNDVSTIQTNPSKQRHDHPEKNSVVPSRFPPKQEYENNQQQHPSPRRYIPLKDADSREYQEQHAKRKPLQERGKLKSENDWADHYGQSVGSKQAHDLSNLMITSNPIVNRTKNQSKMSDKHFFTANFDEIDSHHHHQHKVHSRHPSLLPHQKQSHSHHHHHHHHHPLSIPSAHTHPTQSSSHHSSQQSHHDDYHQQHLHIRRRSSSGAYVDSEVQIVDILFEESEQHQPPPRASVLYTQTHYLPPIIHKRNPTRFPAGYHGTLNRQPNNKPWQNPIGEAKTYKSELHSRYSDHHFHTVIDKRLAV